MIEFTAISREDFEAKGLPLKNSLKLSGACDIIPDTYFLHIGRKFSKDNSVHSFFNADKENGNLEYLNKVLAEATVIEKEQEMYTSKGGFELACHWVIDYFIPYDVEESSKNRPTYTDDYIGPDFCVNGHYEADYEILFSASDNVTRRMVLTSRTSMLNFINYVAEMIDEAFDDYEYSDNPFTEMFIKTERDDIDDDEEDEYCYDTVHEIKMHDEMGVAHTIEVENAEQLKSMIVSVRQLDCKFIEK